MTNTFANTSSYAHIALKRRLNLRERRALAAVIDAAHRAPGSLRVLNKADWIYTAQLRDGRTRWRIEDSFRNLIASGECS